MNRKAASVLATALLSGGLITACSSSGATTSSPSANASGNSKAKYTIAAVVADSADPFYLQMKCGAMAAAKASGVQLLWQGNTSVDVTPEVAALNAVEQRKPDGIMLAPFDPNVFVQPVRALMASGTPVVTVDGSLAQRVDMQNIHTDNVGAGAMAADALGQALHGKGSVGVVSFAPGIPVQADRVNGFKAEMSKKYPGIRVLPTQYGGADSGKSASVVAALLRANPDLAGLYGTDTNDATGASSAVRAAGEQGRVKVVAYDAAPAEVQGLKAGLFYALIAQAPYQEGYQAITTLYNVLSGKESKASVTYSKTTGATVVTAANVDSPQLKHVLYTPNC